MSAGTLASVRGDSQQIRPTTRAGYTTISPGTMTQLITAVAAEACNVPSKDVRASLRDEQGQLSVQLAVPLALWDPARMGNDGGTIFERAAAARALVAARIQELAGTAVRRVDIRYTGIHGQDHRKVRRVQ
ncbi:hypothetical protein [Arthrobacter glacialis]|uniref:hypothetical protein n=1 Tax=Arthrobacter glacialis TaxID=1664 RepID=UPI000CD42290|nr:hypothetical protein [Arthrobacter glacialis]POH61201.1 hypothetical protein CVS28_01515 [Arthrobacter glacialis]